MLQVLKDTKYKLDADPCLLEAFNKRDSWAVEIVYKNFYGALLYTTYKTANFELDVRAI